MGYHVADCRHLSRILYTISAVCALYFNAQRGQWDTSQVDSVLREDRREYQEYDPCLRLDDFLLTIIIILISCSLLRLIYIQFFIIDISLINYFYS